MRKGFTILELIIVIGIMSALIAFAGFSYTGTVRKSRDVIRKEDIKRIQIALELYKNENGHYPISSNTCTTIKVWELSSDFPPPAPPPNGICLANWIPELDSKYITNLPRDPINNTTLSFSL